MKWLRIAAAVAAWCFISGPAVAQLQTTVVAQCPGLSTPYSAGQLRNLTIDVNGNLCVSGAAASGGAVPAKYLSAASTNSTNVKASAGQVYAIVAINTTATLYYLKLYDKASAPTCNSDAVVQSYPVPASPTATGAGLALPIPVGMSFSLGIGFCLTGALADNDNTVAATGVAINVMYK